MTHEPSGPDSAPGHGVVVESGESFWRMVAKSLRDEDGRNLIFKGPGAFALAGMSVAWMWASVGSEPGAGVFWVGVPIALAGSVLSAVAYRAQVRELVGDGSRTPRYDLYAVLGGVLVLLGLVLPPYLLAWPTS